MEVFQTMMTELMIVFIKVQDKQVLKFQVCEFQYSTVIVIYFKF